MKYKISFLFTFLFALIFSSVAQTPTSVIYKIDIKKEIGSTTWIYVQKGFEEAKQLNASHIIIHMNTYGGEVVFADSIRTKILNSNIPVSVFIDNNAASAGALISIACNNIFMRKGANIGAATVVNETGEKMPDKYQSYMRATIRSTAEAHGKDTIISGNDTTYRWKRDPLIAEAMVDERVVVPNMNDDSTKILTFTAEEALRYHYCEAIVENIPEIIEQYLGYNDYELKEFKPSVWDNIKGFLTSSMLRGILIMIIIGGIYFELQTPGIGFPLLAAACAAVLYFSPLYIDGLATYWEIIMFIVGLILLAVELFVIPGFGIAGVLGILFIVSGLTLSLLDNVNFDFTNVDSSALNKAALTVVGGLFGAATFAVYFSSKIGSSGVFKSLSMEKTMDNKDGYIGVPTEQTHLIGKIGVAATVLRLSGKVIVDNKMYDAVSENGFIEKDIKVKVTRYETGQIYVEKA